jgi:cytochrome c oxidase subunit 2
MVFCLIPRWNILNFQNASSHIILEFIFFHDWLNIVLIFIISVVRWIMNRIWFNKVTNLFLVENQKLESIWILAPSVGLVKIGVPSLYLLYITDDVVESYVRLKVNAQQWFWRYEYSDFWPSDINSSLEIGAYMIPQTKIEEGIIRLLDTNMRPALPFLVQTRVLITSLDVLHCWTIPALGVKVDASPGRVNQVKFFTYQPGVFYGQCSEICGTNHRFMPISLEFFNPEIFLNWMDICRQ